MRYGTIGGLGDRIGRIVLGTGWFSPERMEDVGDILDAFLAGGGTAVDTAPVYGNGASERAIGQWLRESGRREDVVIITKGAHPDLSDWVPRVNPEAIRHDLDESLQRLGVDTVDFLRSIESGEPMETDGDQGLRDLACCFSVLESAALARPVAVADVVSGKVDAYQREVNGHYGLKRQDASSSSTAIAEQGRIQ